MGTRSPSSPIAADKEVKRKPSDPRNPSDTELPSLKRSRHDDTDTPSDEDRRRHRSRRGLDRDEDCRALRKTDSSPSSERKRTDRNGTRLDSHSEKHRDSRRERVSNKRDGLYPSDKHRESRRDRVSPHRNYGDDDGSDGQSRSKQRHRGGHGGDRVSNEKNGRTTSPDRKHGDVDLNNGRWESRAHREERTHETERVVEQKSRYSPSPERIRRGQDRKREHSSSPVRKRRVDDRSPSPYRKRRNGGQQESPSRHRDRGRYDGDRASDKKERVFSRDDDRAVLRDAQPSGRDDRVAERDRKVHEKYDRSKDTDRNAGAQGIDRDIDGRNFDRRAGEKDAGVSDRDNDVLDRYVGDEVHDKNDTERQNHDRASNSHKSRRNEEEKDTAGENRRRGRSRGKEDDKDNYRSSRRSRENDRHDKHKSWASMVEEDELAEKENKRDSTELNKHVNQHSRSKASSHETEMHAAGKGSKDSMANVPAANANTEQPQGRTGGVYIPPFKLAQMMKEIQDKSGVEYQRMTWDALRKSINGLVNKVNASNIKNIVPELMAENLIRGRGLFARSCMKSQMASPLFTHVFAALVAVVNTKFPELGELLLKRVILQFRRALKRNDKPLLLAAARFIAHLVNQQVAHEVVALEVLMVLLENPTDDSVEVSVGFVKECGAILQDLAPQGLHGIFERFRGILHEGEIDKRVQFMIEGLFAIRKAGFQGHPAVIPDLDLVDQEDQFTHEISLSEDLDAEMSLDIFQPDPNFLENEKKYEGIKREILGEESSDDDDGEKGSGESSEDDEDDEDDEEEFQRMKIKDETETNLVNLRRTIYLTIMSSVDFEEAGHKLLKIKLEPGQEMELNIMLLECCSQERTYLRYYGLLGQRFCMINKIYQENFDECFVKQYSMIHRLETNKLRNVAKFFAHLLGTDALPWNVLEYIKLTEEDTTSSSRIFIKILFQELSEHLGLRKLNEKLNDPDMERWFDGIFPKDNPKNTRFAINFFTSIGLGGITDSLREHLKKMPRLIMQQQRQVMSESESLDSEDSSESESSSSESESESSSSESESSSDSDSDSRKKRKRR